MPRTSPQRLVSDSARGHSFEQAVLTVYSRKRHIAGVRRNRMKPGGMLEADLEFRRNRPFATEPKNREAVVQLQQSISLSGRQQRSDTRLTAVQTARQIPVIAFSSPTTDENTGVHKCIAGENPEKIRNMGRWILDQ